MGNQQDLERARFEVDNQQMALNISCEARRFARSHQFRLNVFGKMVPAFQLDPLSAWLYRRLPKSFVCRLDDVTAATVNATIDREIDKLEGRLNAAIVARDRLEHAFATPYRQ